MPRRLAHTVLALQVEHQGHLTDITGLSSDPVVERAGDAALVGIAGHLGVAHWCCTDVEVAALLEDAATEAALPA